VVLASRKATVVADRAQAEFTVELEDAHALEGRVRQDLPHVHEPGVGLHPDSGPQIRSHRAADLLEPQALRRLLGHRRHELAEHHRDDHEHRADPPERPHRLPRREPGDAHHGELGVRRQRGERGKRADQHGDREQLVRVPRQQQRDVQERVLQAVAALAEIVELVDEIEEGEQREKRNEHERRRLVDLSPEIAVDGPHGARALNASATA
jgi:hypothetical protein